MDELTSYVDGTWSDPDERKPVHNPADGSVVGTIGYGGAEQARDAADAAAAAFDEWSRTTGRFRADLLRAVAEDLDDRAEEIGALLARESGKRRPEGVGEIHFSAEYFRWFAEQARRPHGGMAPAEAPGRRHLWRYRPRGVAACLTPWNFPVSIQARKLAPALAAGCTTVSRVSEKAPLAAVELFRSIDRAGFPAGVANLVHGPASTLTEALLAHPAVRTVSFTGSTGVGQSVMRQAADRIVRPALELGGDAAMIVLDDADVDAAVTGAMLGKFRNNGQSCIGVNRFLVQNGIYDAFVEKLVAAVNAMTVGDPSADPVPDLGPLIDAARTDAVEAIVAEALGAEALGAGARRLTREFDLPTGGSFAAPALFGEVPDDVALATSEVFGPVAGVFRFGDDEQALSRANDTEMGLASYVYGRDMARVEHIVGALQAGITGVNTTLPSVAFAPMGGVKQSGLGREGGELGIEEFCDVQYVGYAL